MKTEDVIRDELFRLVQVYENGQLSPVSKGRLGAAIRALAWTLAPTETKFYLRLIELRGVDLSKHQDHVKPSHQTANVDS